MFRILIVLLFLSNNLAAQESVKDSDKFQLLETYTQQNYQVPDSILFYATNHIEMSYQYDLIFKRIKSKTKRTEINTEYNFEIISHSNNPELFYDLDSIAIETKNYNIVCFFDISTTNQVEKKFCKNGECTFFYYIKLYDIKNKNVLLKRKYIVKTHKYYYTEAKELADLIIKELQLKS